MKYMKLLLILTVFTLFVVSCSSDSPLEPDMNNNQNNLKLSRLSTIQQNVFTTTCAVSGCHAGNNPQAGLLLTSGNAFSNLVNVTSTQNPPMLRVKPGDSNNSWLMKKLRAEGTDVMPPTGMLSAAVIDSIAKWIDNGANND